MNITTKTLKLARQALYDVEPDFEKTDWGFGDRDRAMKQLAAEIARRERKAKR